eukprot:TRINITY_DN7555_c0_g1_i4.p1 TRINITY_DN7555_c0_g1~~TRINITY_DN7555_c0_g1_i4.p1  ORF type:complete len:698 (-),score=105.19 TRINITY_DN7555_c0_g1_i4:951-3044(-)
MTNLELLQYVDEYFANHLDKGYWSGLSDDFKGGAVAMALSDVLAQVSGLTPDKITSGSAAGKAVAEQAVFLARNYNSLSEGKVVTSEGAEGVSGGYTLLEGATSGISFRAMPFIRQAKRAVSGNSVRLSRGQLYFSILYPCRQNCRQNSLKRKFGTIVKKTTLTKFDAISESARERIYAKVLGHYKKHPESPWSGKHLVELERTIKAFYASLGEEYKGAFRATLPDFMQQFYDQAKSEIRKSGVYKAIIGDPDPKRIQYFLNSAFEQIAMRTDKMAFENIRDLRKLSADVFREMSITGGTRRAISKRMLDRAMEIRGFEFIDNSGSKWPLKSYFDTLARTELMNAGRASYDDKMAEEGFDAMKLSTSGHSCPKCARFEGKLFSLTDTTPGLPSKADLEADGVFHPNCTHSYSLVPDFIRERDYNADGTPKTGHNSPQSKIASQVGPCSGAQSKPVASDIFPDNLDEKKDHGFVGSKEFVASSNYIPPGSKEFPLGSSGGWPGSGSSQFSELYDQESVDYVMRAAKKGKDFTGALIGNEQAFDEMIKVAGNKNFVLKKDQNYTFGLSTKGVNAISEQLKSGEVLWQGSRYMGIDYKRVSNYATGDGDGGAIFRVTMKKGQRTVHATVFDLPEAVLLPGSKMRILNKSVKKVILNGRSREFTFFNVELVDYGTENIIKANKLIKKIKKIVHENKKQSQY